MMFDVDQERIQKALSLTQVYDQEAERYLRAHPKSDAGSLDRALTFLKGISFVGREPNYLSHAVRLAVYFVRFGHPVSQRGTSLALLHNMLEVSDIPAEELEDEFGEWIVKACRILTIDRKRQKEDSLYLREYYGALNDSAPEIQQVKIFDKLDNLLVLFLNPSDEVRTKYLQEIETWILPMVVKQTPALEKAFLKMVQDARALGHMTLENFIQRYGVK